jgi:two-component system, chemotaxis family, sensor kinase CheA
MNLPQNTGKDPMIDMFVFDTYQLIEQLEQSVLMGEKTNNFEGSIDEIFRIMHTLKGNSAMMAFDSISKISHHVEDLFDYLRKEKPQVIDYSKIVDIVLDSIDFIKSEMSKLEEGNTPNGNIDSLKAEVAEILNSIKGSTYQVSQGDTTQNQHYSVSNLESSSQNVTRYQVLVYFEKDCDMENVRAFTVLQNLEELVTDMEFYPIDILENFDSAHVIKEEGFRMTFNSSLDFEAVKTEISKAAYVQEVKLEIVNEKKEQIQDSEQIQEPEQAKEATATQEVQKFFDNRETTAGKQDFLNVSVDKLDTLMDLVGELVIAESMVTRHPEIEGLELEGFNKVSRQLRKIINELQDVTMSVRLVSVGPTFNKMTRIVRDMSKKLDKEVNLVLVGEDTEVDKSIIEQLADPLMHIIRNSIDHGIERSEDRMSKGKNPKGQITLEAKNEGGDVCIIIKDDGKGLNKEAILKRAREHGLFNKSESELTDREIYSFIFLPGFSTKENITEYSGRGVGMDVVVKNIESVRGKVYVDSAPDKGTTITIKIPLTLAIIEGMTVKVGKSKYTIPITSIKESFKVSKQDIIIDPDGSQMIMIRGKCYPILKLHQCFNVETDITDVEEGIVVMVEHDKNFTCIFVDNLLAGQQVVIKPMPRYIKTIKGIAGCTLLGDGNISLVIDVAGLVS